MNPIYDFKGQVALVTGAPKGWGWRRRGCSPRAAPPSSGRPGRRSRRERGRADRPRGRHRNWYPCDVADEAQVAAMVDRAVADTAGSTWL